MSFSVWGSETHTSLCGGKKRAAILPAHKNTFLILPLSAALMRDRSCVAAVGGVKHISGAWITTGVCVCVTACPLFKRAVFLLSLTAAVSAGTGLRGFHYSPGEQKLNQVSTPRKQLNAGVSFVERMKMDVCKPNAAQLRKFKKKKEKLKVRCMTRLNMCSVYWKLHVKMWNPAE